MTSPVEASIKQADVPESDKATPVETAAISVRAAKTDGRSKKHKRPAQRLFFKIAARFMISPFLLNIVLEKLCVFGIDICKKRRFIRFLAKERESCRRQNVRVCVFR